MKRPTDNWIRCKNCGHKLFKIVDEGGVRIQTKCHSCKAINDISITNNQGGTKNAE